MTRLLALGMVLTAVLGSGVTAGLWSGRWGNSTALQQAIARLDRVPLTLGEQWDVQEEKLTPREVAVAEMDGYLARKYIHRPTGAAVTMLLICGRSGPLSVHTPEVCYAGAGFGRTGQQSHEETRAQFHAIDFLKHNAATPTRLRVFLAWGYKGEWSAPNSPRTTFAGKPYLYKLYVTRGLTAAGEPLDKDVAAELIRDLLPQLQETLFAGS